MERIEKLERLKRLKSEINSYRRERALTVLLNTVKGLLLGSPILISTILYGIYVAKTKDIPGHRDYKDVYAHTKTEYSSSVGEIEYEKKYEEYKNAKDNIRYYSAWKLNEDGSYERSIKTYILEDMSEEKLLELSKKETITTDDVLGIGIKQTDETVQRKETVSEEELNEGSYYEVTVYGVDKEDTIKVKETSDEAVTEVLKVVFVAVCLLHLEVATIRAFDPDFESIGWINDRIEKCKEEKKELEEEINPVKIK